jgi:hypothetical protein
MGKGDTTRPSHVSKEKYDDNFEAVFGRKELPLWEDAPQVERGDRPDSGQADEVLEGPNGLLHQEAPDSMEKKGEMERIKCPSCVGGETYPRKGFHFDHERMCGNCGWIGEIK